MAIECGRHQWRPLVQSSQIWRGFRPQQPIERVWVASLGSHVHGCSLICIPELQLDMRLRKEVHYAEQPSIGGGFHESDVVGTDQLSGLLLYT